MRRSNSSPFWRESKGAFYCWIDGHQRSLGKTRRAADARYRELLADREKLAARRPWTVRECFDHYLEHAATLKPNSFRNRRQALDRFCAEAVVGRLPYYDLTVDHLEAWVRRHPGWSASMRRTCIDHVMAAFNHCLKRKKIRENPVLGVEKPRWERRKAVLGAEDERKVHEAAKGEFRDILTALRETGARPGELCSARVEHYAKGVITLSEHKEDASGEPRTIYLSDAIAALVERRIAGRAEGPIFLNDRGKQSGRAATTPTTRGPCGGAGLGAGRLVQIQG